MGVRTALGATPAAIIGLVLGRDTSDILTLTFVPVLFITAGTIACWGPARHAARVNPTDTLRAE